MNVRSRETMEAEIFAPGTACPFASDRCSITSGDNWPHGRTYWIRFPDSSANTFKSERICEGDWVVRSKGQYDANFSYQIMNDTWFRAEYEEAGPISEPEGT